MVGISFSEQTCHATFCIAAELVCSVEQHPYEIHLTHLIGEDVVFVPQRDLVLTELQF